MLIPMRRVILGLAAVWLVLPVVTAAQDQLLVQKDFDSLSDSEQWMASDAWCVAAIDIALETPGYNPDQLGVGRKANVDEFIDGEGGTQEELDANVAYAKEYYGNSLKNGETTVDQMLDGCVYDAKGTGANS